MLLNRYAEAFWLILYRLKANTHSTRHKSIAQLLLTEANLWGNWAIHLCRVLWRTFLAYKIIQINGFFTYKPPITSCQRIEPSWYIQLVQRLSSEMNPHYAFTVQLSRICIAESYNLGKQKIPFIIHPYSFWPLSPSNHVDLLSNQSLIKFTKAFSLSSSISETSIPF